MANSTNVPSIRATAPVADLGWSTPRVRVEPISDELRAAFPVALPWARYGIVVRHPDGRVDVLAAFLAESASSVPMLRTHARQAAARRRWVFVADDIDTDAADAECAYCGDPCGEPERSKHKDWFRANETRLREIADKFGTASVLAA